MYAPSSPTYAPSSPAYAPSSPAYRPSSPQSAYSPTNAPSTPVYALPLTTNAPSSPTDTAMSDCNESPKEPPLRLEILPKKSRWADATVSQILENNCR